jgi:peroxiredoxin
MLAPLALTVQASPTLERAGDFALIDHKGDFHQLSRYRHVKALVILSQANSCQNNAKVVAEFSALRDKWTDKGIAFALMNSSANDDLESIRQAAHQQKLDLPVMVDHAQLVAETVSIAKAGEVVILDPERYNILYRGPVHDHINMMLNDILAGTEIKNTMVMPVEGCALEFPSKAMHAKNIPDYTKDVAPIFAENCAMCHREGGIGPFAMDGYNMMAGWAPMVRETLMAKRMPPQQVDPALGHFENARYLSDKDLQTLVHWIDAGAPRGNGKEDPLTAVEYPDLWAWQLGEPDYIIDAPAFDIPATGVVDYFNADVDLNFPEDKWVRAVQFIPGDPGVLHHLLAYVTAPKENFDGGEGGRESVARRFLEGYAPGKIDSMEFPADTGVYIPKGHKLSMQFHYTTNGKASTDKTKIGLYFYDKPPKYELLTQSVSGRFTVPPYARNHPASAEFVFQEPITVHRLRAHMHFRGHDMQFSVEFPDGTRQTLLNVPNYNFNWQPTYGMEDPVTLPAGTKVHVTGHFDNSEFNPGNPDPSKELTFGLQSWDEMFIGYWTYHKVVQTNEDQDLITQQ